MRSRALRIIICLLIVLAIPLSLITFVVAVPPQYGQTYLAGLSVKWKALNESTNKKLVIAGGSGVAFDIRSDLLEQELDGYKVVNFGLYAGLGTTVMLDLMRSQLHEGDIVIFSPELSGQTMSTYFSAESMWQACDGNTEPLLSLGSEYAGRMVGAFPAFAASKMRYYLANSAPQGDGVYAASSFNRYGDIDYPDREYNIMPDGVDRNIPIVFDGGVVGEDFLKKVNDFHHFCESKGITYYFSWCPMNAAAVSAAQKKQIGSFASYLRANLDCEIIGDINSAILEPEWFYDTNFHLNRSGAIVNTALLAGDLKAALGDTSPVEIELPAMPVAEKAEESDGNNSDLDCFVCRKDGDTAVITALTGQGRLKEKLTVPVSFDGAPIIRIEDSTFADDTHIKEIAIQSNIRQIADHSFSGCVSLKKITVENSSPASCNVGRYLLDGTDAVVYVPRAAYSAYCTNYFWSVYANRLRAYDTDTRDASSDENTEDMAKGGDILYHGNGGELIHQSGDRITKPAYTTHLRTNTAQGTAYFSREGYVLTGWNTAADGSGEQIGLGSRTNMREGLALYAQWAKANDEADFTYHIENDEAIVTAYHGGDGVCVIPEELGGKPVRMIKKGAFQVNVFKKLVLPSSLRVIEEGAFSGCDIGEMILFDSIKEIGDGSFVNCRLPHTLYVNAATAPVYSGSYYDTFADKFDYLLSIQDQKKIVLFSGSSGRYGYDTPAIVKAFPDYAAVNMGVYAYTNAKPQLEIIRTMMRQGDILLSAPEFDAIEEQFCTTNRLDRHFWAMAESNYDAVTLLDLRDYSGVFDSLGEYLGVRFGMEGKGYGLSPSSYDDDGNRYNFATYNACGDFILPRENGEKDERQHLNTADYHIDSFPRDYLDSLNAVYDTFTDQGATVYFSYTPRNRSSLTERSTPQAREELHRYLTKHIGVPVISDIEDYLLSGVYFWKIDSHPSTEGAQIRTERLISDLRKAMK
jgi:hypothetical protein